METECGSMCAIALQLSQRRTRSGLDRGIDGGKEAIQVAGMKPVALVSRLCADAYAGTQYRSKHVTK